MMLTRSQTRLMNAIGFLTALVQFVAMAGPATAQGMEKIGTEHSVRLCGRDVSYKIYEGKNPSEFLGVWSGDWSTSSHLCGGLIVEGVHDDIADIIYVYGQDESGSNWP